MQKGHIALGAALGAMLINVSFEMQHAHAMQELMTVEFAGRLVFHVGTLLIAFFGGHNVGKFDEHTAALRRISRPGRVQIPSVARRKGAAQPPSGGGHGAGGRGDAGDT